MFSKFLPRESNFFDMFSEQVDYAIDAAKFFKEVVAKGQFDESAMARMQAIEHQGDDAAHTIIDQLNKTFITPFDREDIHALVKEIDDIIDMITTIVSRLKVYKISRTNQNLVEFASMIDDSVTAVACAVKAMRDMKHSKDIMNACVEINSLENAGDDMRDRVLGELFENEKNAIEIIKWKEIYQDAETVLDICEDVAHVVSSILVKQT